MGNAAEAGSGGGVRFQGVNGVEVSTFPSNPERWYTVSVTNNIITNNVAGWDGGGVSLQDAIGVNLVNNTVVSNDSTASSGTLFGAFFATQASAPTPCPSDPNPPHPQLPCVPLSDPQPAGLSAAGHSAEFLASLPASITCPPGHPLNTANPNNGVVNGACRAVSFPILYNDVFWQNRAFNIVVTNPSAASGVQQATVTLVPQLNQTTTGQCVAPPAGTTYWDIGLRGDHGPENHSSGFTFQPKASVLTDINGYPGGPGASFRANTSTFSPGVARQYCNGSKVPPEAGAGSWYQTPPGTNESNVPIPIFNLTAGATVDEGNNWVNISWGPLSLVNPTAETNPSTETLLGDYSLAAGSPAINFITPANSITTYAVAPANDFFENARKTNNAVDAGAVEFAGLPGIVSVTPTSLSFGSVIVGTSSANQTLTLFNNSGTGMTGIVVTVTAPFSQNGGTCTATLTSGANCTILVRFQPTALGAANGTVTITGTLPVSGSPVSLSGTGSAPTLTASASPSPLAFGNWATGTTSNARNVTVTNTGTSALAGGTFTFTAPFSRVTTGTFPAGAPNCGATLAIGASCTVKVQFAPTAVTSSAGSLTIAYTGATVTPTPVSLTGTGVAARATVSITPNPLLITLPTGVLSGTGIVTLTNTAPAGTGAQMTVTSATASGGTIGTFFFNSGALAGPDTCTGATLAPAASCTVTVRFTNVASPRGVDRAGTITFTDSGAASPQVGALVGHANP
jgi:hypothetical protein